MFARDVKESRFQFHSLTLRGPCLNKASREPEGAKLAAVCKKLAATKLALLRRRKERPMCEQLWKWKAGGCARAIRACITLGLNPSAPQIARGSIGCGLRSPRACRSQPLFENRSILGLNLDKRDAHPFVGQVIGHMTYSREVRFRICNFQSDSCPFGERSFACNKATVETQVASM